MKALVRTAWITDLRENPDAQGIGFLDYIDSKGKHRQCCLGRLCRLAVAAGVIPAPELHVREYRYLDDDHSDYGKVTGERFHQACALPRKVAEWAGLPPGADDIKLDSDEDGSLLASEANDEAGMTFAEIADLAERNVPVTE